MSTDIYDDFYSLLAAVRTRKEAELLLQDLLSPAEIENIAARWDIMQRIAAVQSHRDIARSVHTSIAKVSRCASGLRHGNGAIPAWLHTLGKAVKISNKDKKTRGSR